MVVGSTALAPSPHWVPGYCYRTAEGADGRGDCATGLSGVLHVPPPSWSSVEALSSACALACSQCARCYVISFSATARDCSWYRYCELRHVRSRRTHFTTRVRRALPRERNVSQPSPPLRLISLADGALSRGTGLRGAPASAPVPLRAAWVSRRLGPSPQHFFGQESQDLCLAESVFAGRTGGFYLDLASNDARLLSNTHALDRLYNWSASAKRRKTQPHHPPALAPNPIIPLPRVPHTPLRCTQPSHIAAPVHPIVRDAGPGCASSRSRTTTLATCAVGRARSPSC